MNVLIADKFPDQQQATLEQLGFAVTFQPTLGADDLPGVVGDAQILIVRSTKVTETTIKAAKSLQLIVRAGAGTNTIDCKAASAHGIAVANCPGKNAIAVAELTMGLVLALDRSIPDNVADVRRGVWNKALYGKAARGLYGRTLGVVGLGQVGEARGQARLAGVDRVEEPDLGAGSIEADLHQALQRCLVITRKPLHGATTNRIGQVGLADIDRQVLQGGALATSPEVGDLRAGLLRRSDAGVGDDGVGLLPGGIGQHPADRPGRRGGRRLAVGVLRQQRWGVRQLPGPDPVEPGLIVGRGRPGLVTAGAGGTAPAGVQPC